MGVGNGVGVGIGVAVGVGIGVGVIIGVGDGNGVGEGLGVAKGVGEGVGLCVLVAPIPPQPTAINTSAKKRQQRRLSRVTLTNHPLAQKSAYVQTRGILN